MDRLHIPDTATETYLEHLAENITRQVEKATNKKVREHLEDMLHEVYTRLQALRRKTEQFPEKAAMAENLEVLELTEVMDETSPPAPVVAQVQQVKEPTAPAEEQGEETAEGVVLELDEEAEELAENLADLTAREQEVVKDRLREALSKFQDKKQAAPQTSDSVLLEDVIQEIGKEIPAEATDLSTLQQKNIKGRLKGLLQGLHDRQQPPKEPALDEDIQATLTYQHQQSPPVLGKVARELEKLAHIRPEDLPAEYREEKPEFHPLSKDAAFTEACQRVSEGQSLDLLKNLPLSEREQDMLQAFAAYHSSYKGLKKQQVFEMQYLTSRSIHELDLIFKTYHIQGYLKAELTNVYNRLLNLRGRFSILVH